MNYAANAKLMLTKCRDCLGCNRLEDENFAGDDKCNSYRRGIADAEKIRLKKEELQHE